jgi:hypothetical protein
MAKITIQTRTDARNAVMNSGHRDRFATSVDFDAAVNAVWRATRDGLISVEQFNEICDEIVEDAIADGIDAEADRSRA